MLASRVGMTHLNILLGTLVVAVGLWLLRGALSPIVVTGGILAVGGFLWWKARTMTEVWAWSTLFLGLESFAWPLILMIQLKSATMSPTENDMGNVLLAVVLGLFSSVFWISFSYGLFKRAQSAAGSSSLNSSDQRIPQPSKRNRPR
jgi:hypothetical protein